MYYSLRASHWFFQIFVACSIIINELYNCVKSRDPCKFSDAGGEKVVIGEDNLHSPGWNRVN